WLAQGKKLQRRLRAPSRAQFVLRDASIGLIRPRTLCLDQVHALGANQSWALPLAYPLAPRGIGGDAAASQQARAARCNAARASKAVESKVGRVEFASVMIKGNSVHPKTTASQPRPCNRRIARRM